MLRLKFRDGGVIIKCMSIKNKKKDGGVPGKIGVKKKEDGNYLKSKYKQCRLNVI